MKKQLKYILIGASIVLLGACANMFNGAVLPNQCKECKVVNTETGITEWKIEGCGSENTGLEEKAKQQAYDLSRTGSNLCKLEVQCRSWKKEPDQTQ